VGWTLFAFAGAYRWTTIPLIAGAILLTLIVRPAIGRRTAAVFDLALAACLAGVALQLVPLAPRLRLALSPHLSEIEQALWLDTNPLTGPLRPISIDPDSTRWAFALAFAFALIFWSAREAFARGSVRTVVRGVAWTGLLLAATALLQHATAPKRLYWIYPTIFGAPFGPYLNRNDFATWLIMGIPVTIGYLLARIDVRHRRDDGGVRLEAAADPIVVGLIGSACLMSAALVTSVSRSGLTAAATATMCFLYMGRDRLGRGGRAWLLVGVASIVGVAAAYANVGALADRVGETMTAGIGGRRTIWRETWPMARDFFVTGVGAGAYQRGMLVYQQSKGLFYFNHAHNEYLQFAAEGGLLLCVPLAITLGLGMGYLVRRVHADNTPIFWIRVGAVTGMLAVAVQSFFDTGLRMPANTVLFAVLAALALHKPAPFQHQQRDSATS
jgi:putative inorganic carbon (HCO3(-)) transporter